MAPPGRLDVKHDIVLATWTDQGIRNVHQSPERLDAFKALREKHGAAMRSFPMTMGAHDMVVHMDAPDDAVMARIARTLARAGNIRTTTLPAFDEAADRKITAG